MMTAMRGPDRRLGSGIILCAVLLGSSAALYALQLVVFGRTADTFYYLLQDAAFLPIQAILVTFGLDALLARREKQHVLMKLSMVIGAFFGEVGNRLLARCVAVDPDRDALRAAFADPGNWAKTERTARELVREHPCTVEASASDLEAIKSCLAAERGFLLGLLENPNLLERETFTDMLFAVVHLSEELGYRHAIADLPATDLRHLKGDLERVYRLLIVEWTGYATHLKTRYPYIFSLIVRTHPLRVDPSAVVT
jgi:hypothetical protein